MASIPAEKFSFVLTQSKPLRLLTLLLFYFTQGFPIGLFFYAIPAWMAANGADTVAIAAVAGASALPWSLKLVNGLIIDRYTFLPMGRRRVWIIGAQTLIVVGMLAGAAIAPVYSDVFLLSAIGFCVNVAVTFQDVGIDSLAVDIMAEDERARAAGIMMGAQVMGTAAAMALGGALLERFGVAVCLLVTAIVPAMVVVYGVAIREREGERSLPWSQGSSHPRNMKIQVDAWWPLLQTSIRAVLMPVSLLLLPVLLFRMLPNGAGEAFEPILFTQRAGWGLSEYTGYGATVRLITGMAALVVGGWLVDAIGPQRSALIAICLGVVLFIGMGLSEALWSDSWFLVSYTLAANLIAMFYAISVLPLCMRLCSPSVAATQFTIYMAISNFGLPLGTQLAAYTAGAGMPVLMYYLLASAWAVAAIIMLVARFPAHNRQQDEAAEVLPQGDGLIPAVD